MTRVRFGLAVVIAAALLPAVSVFVQVATNPQTFRPRDDPISAFERQLAPLRETLRGERIVGYLAPAQVPDRAAHLYTVRYVLAPVQVIDSIEEPIVVAEGVADGQHLPAQLRVRRDFGRSLLLLERAP